MALLTLAYLKSFLNITGATEDAELQSYVDSVTDVVEGILGGPVEQRIVIENNAAVGDGGRAILLGRRFATALVSISAGGTAVSTADAYLASGGVVRRRGGLAFVSLAPPLQVAYYAGIGVTAPAACQLAAAIIAGHLYDTQRGQVGAGPGDDYAGTDAIPGLGFAVPNRALELLSPWTAEFTVA